MGKSPHFQQGKPSQPQAQGPQGQTRMQPPVHSAIQPRTVVPPQGAKPAPPPVHWPQPASHVLQRKAAEGQRNSAEANPAVPPVYWPQPAPHAVQRKAAGAGQRTGAQAGPAVPPVREAVPPAHGVRPEVAQLASLCNCHKPGNKHKSSCPANPKRKKAKAKEVKVVHHESQSFMNLYAYDSVWATQRSITESMVKEFVASYGKIHGHASSRADKDAKRHANTSKDLAAFHSWYNQKHGERKY
jgi:hypothetical protein